MPTPLTARRIDVHALDDVRVELTRVAEPGPGEVLVRPTTVGICGSDLHAARGVHPFIGLPYQPGHEVVGVVVADPTGNLAPGTRVVLEPNVGCGVCGNCRDGRYNICDELSVIGCQSPGGLTDAFCVPADRLHLVPDGLDDTTAVLTEPLATPVHAVRRAGDLTGTRVVVLGAGPIGLFLLLAARDAGAAEVACLDLVDSKRARAQRLGASGAVDAAAPDAVERTLELLGGPADVVFDAVSRESSVRQAVGLLRKGGRLLTVGVAAGPTTIPLDLVQDRELELLGCLMFTRTDVAAALDLLCRGVVPVEEIVTATFGLDEAAAAFRATADPEQVKVLVRV